MRLTIAIPTFNRPDVLFDTVSELLSFPNSNLIDLLVVDNGSSINIPDFLKTKIPITPNLFVKRFDTNDGFYESFYRLFDICQTDYLMVLSDEDIFDLTRLKEVLKILTTKSPNLLVVSSKNKTRFLSRSNFMRIPLYRLKDESSYISGLIFKTKPVKENLNFFRYISKAEEFAFLYPAVLVAYVLALNGKSLRLKKAGIIYRTIVPTSIKSSNGVSYKLPTERVHQYLSLKNCFQEMKAHYSSNTSLINRYEFYEKMNFFGLIFNSIGFISPTAKVDFLIASSKSIFIFYVREFFKLIKLNRKYR